MTKRKVQGKAKVEEGPHVLEGYWERGHQSEWRDWLQQWRERETQMERWTGR
jgi:hypothetical protein